MTTKEQIKAIIQQYADKGKTQYTECCDDNESASLINYWDGYRDCANLLLRELEDMQEEPVSVSEDLLKELKGIVNIRECVAQGVPVIKIARHFAAWQKEQMMAKAFDFTQEHNIACILASECLRNHGWFSRERVFNNLFRHLACVDKLFEGKFCGKTKVIVIKE